MPLPRFAIRAAELLPLLSATMIVTVMAWHLPVAVAGIPVPPNGEIPCGITLVGTNGAVADPRGEFRVRVWDLANNPIPGASIAILFDGCPDIRIGGEPGLPGNHVDCPGNSVSGVTDANGTVLFRIVGAASNTSGSTPVSPFKCATVYADGILLGGVNVAAFDQNGSGGLNPTDLALALSDYLSSAVSGAYLERSDYNCSGTINPADFSLLLQAALAAGSIASASSFCR